MKFKLIDLSPQISDGLVENGSGGDADAALEAAINGAPAQRDDRSDPSVQARMAELEADPGSIKRADPGSIKRALLQDDGSSSKSVSRNVVSEDDEIGNSGVTRKEHAANLRLLASDEVQAEIDAAPPLGNSDAVADALTAKFHLDIAVFGIHTNALTDDVIIEDDHLERGAHWGMLTNEQRGQAVTDGLLDLEDAQELDRLSAQAREVVAQVDAEQSASRTLDGQVNVLASIADELGVEAEAFTEDVLREIAERDGVNPASLSPRDLDSAVRMAVVRDAREKKANAHAQFRHDVIGSKQSVREGLTQAGEQIDPSYETAIPLAQFEYDSLIKAVNARGAGSARAIRAGVAGRTEVDRGMQSFSSLASKIAEKAAKSRGR